MKNTKLFLISLITIFSIVFLIFIYKNYVATTQEDKQFSLKSESYETFNMGTTIKINNIHFCLNSARWSKDSKYGSPKTDYTWLILDCSVKNVGNECIAFSSMMMLKLIDKEGYSQKEVIVANTKGSLDGELSPNQLMRGEIAFEVDTNQSYWEFIFNPDLIDFGQVIYSVKKEQVN